MAGLPQGPLRRLLSRLPSRLRARQPPVSPMSPPGLPPVTRAEILSRYRHLRQISKEQHEAVLDITAADVLLDWARRIDLTQGKTVIPGQPYARHTQSYFVGITRILITADNGQEPLSGGVF
jgi:hypothetical protein